MPAASPWANRRTATLLKAETPALWPAFRLLPDARSAALLAPAVAAAARVDHAHHLRKHRVMPLPPSTPMKSPPPPRGILAKVAAHADAVVAAAEAGEAADHQGRRSHRRPTPPRPPPPPSIMFDIIGPMVCIIIANRFLPILAFIISSIGAIWVIMSWSPPPPPNCAFAGAAVATASNSASARRLAHRFHRAGHRVLL